MDKLTYEDFVKLKTIKKLPETEKKVYISFHEKTWEEDLDTARRQYYAGRLKEITTKEAKKFLKEIVEPFVKILEGML